MNIYQIHFPLVLQVVCLSFKLRSSTRGRELDIRNRNVPDVVSVICWKHSASLETPVAFTLHIFFSSSILSSAAATKVKND